MIEIRASTKVSGKRRWASVAAAQRKVRDDAFYLIRRHGGFFRPNAQGYTTEIAQAGVYTGIDARRYLDVEGLSVVPLKSLQARIIAEAEAMTQAAASLRVMISRPGDLARSL